MPYWIQRVLLGAVFFVFGAVQIRFAIMTVTLIANWDTTPRVSVFIDPGTLAITALPVEDLKKNGAQVGDIVLAEDGEPVHSYLGAGRIYFRHKVGERVSITLRRGSGAPFMVSFVIPPREPQSLVDSIVLIMLNIVTPTLCILLAFLVAFRRTGDPVAYALVALLLCMSIFLKSEAAPRLAWEPLFTWPMYLLDEFASGAFPAAWLWFALLFPDPASRLKLFPWVGWAVGIPFLAIRGLGGIITATELHRAGSTAWIPHWIEPPAWLMALAVTMLITLGFTNFVYKLVNETELTVRRRLRWMLVGLSLGVLPSVVGFGVASLLHFDINRMPAYLLTPVVISPVFVPLTLGYAVLVDRLFDVGVFLRQGLLASKTVTVLRVVLIGALILVVLLTEQRKDISPATRWTISLTAVALALLIRRLTDWTRRWVDRHFFQEAVNTEHLLVELSAEVRRIADPETLLRTVTERIAGAMHVSRVAALIPNGDSLTPAFATANGYAVPPDAVLHQLRQTRQPIAVLGDLFLPIGAGDGLQGILSLGPKRSEEPYSGSDIRLLESVASQTGLALENGRLTAAVAREAAQRERITSELEIARQVQERLFPKAPPAVPGIDLAGHCRPAQTVGGDYYDFLLTPSGGLGLAIGDVAGKGIPAALLMAGLQASLRGLTLAGVVDPADLMAKLNQLIFDATPLNRFATFFYGLYDPATRRLRYSSAGHNPVLLYRAASGEIEWLKTPGVGLGLSRRSRYAQAECVLAPGDVLVLYTDGVTEARNSQDDEFGEDRLVEAVRRCSNATAAALLDEILRETEAFAAGAAQFDDLTLIVARIA